MKKKLLFFLLFATSFNTAIAQSIFNEDDLLGKWVTNQSNPLKIAEIYFKDCHYANRDGYTRIYGDGCEITSSNRSISYFRDYFISPSNRLHLIVNPLDMSCWVFKIISLTSDRMVLSYRFEYREDDEEFEPYNYIKNVEVEFYKEEVSAINEITNETTDSDKIYNLKGQLLENEPDSGVYIQNGKKYIRK